MFRQFYMTFPMSLYESAKLDGCSNLKFIIKILIPLTRKQSDYNRFTFINAWNMYMWPLLVTGSNNMRTVQIGISMLDSVDSQSITLMIAGVVMIIIPSISIFIIGQKQLIRGMFCQSCKGLIHIGRAYSFPILYMCKYYTQFHSIRRDHNRRKIMKKKTVSLLLVAL